MGWSDYDLGVGGALCLHLYDLVDCWVVASWWLVGVRGGKFIGIFTLLLALIYVFCLSFSFMAHCRRGGVRRVAGARNRRTNTRCRSSIVGGPICLKTCSFGSYHRVRVDLNLSLGNNVGIVLRISIPRIMGTLTSRGDSPAFGRTMTRTTGRTGGDRESFVALFIRSCGRLTPGDDLTRLFTARRLGNGIAAGDASTRIRGILHDRIRTTVSGSCGILHAHVSHFNIMRPGVRALRKRVKHVVIRVPNIGRPRHMHGLLRNDTGLRF